jgi:acetolactate decarboxylase
LLIGFFSAIPATSGLLAQASPHDVKIVGAMKNVMWKGELQGTINLDTLANKQYLYGLGPVEHLAGEIMILGGRAYRSSVVDNSTIKIEETYRIKAPFFGYANIEKWVEQPLPDSIRTLQQLESHLIYRARNSSRPFLFRLVGMVEFAKIHIVNLPKGSKVTSPDDAHAGQANYTIRQEPVEILGFFSTNHRSIFTHHDTYLHMHLITEDRKKMGHLDDVVFRRNSVRLLLPVE